MRKITVILVVCALLLTPALPAFRAGGVASGVAGWSGLCLAAEKPSLKIDLRIHVDADWIRLDGSLMVDDGGKPAGDKEGTTAVKIQDVRLGAVPNAIGWVQKGIVLRRAFWTVAKCVAGRCLGDWVLRNKTEAE